MPTELALVPDNEAFLLQKDCAGVWRLTNRMTHEQVALPVLELGAEWCMAVGDNGDCLVVAEDESHPARPPSDVIGHTTFVAPDGVIFMVTDPENPESEVISMATQLKEHSIGEVKFTLGQVGLQVSFEIAWFSRAHDGCFIMWSLPSLHTLLGLSQSRQGTSKPGRWAACSWSAWQRRAEEFGVAGGLLRSRLVSSSDTRQDHAMSRRVLSFPSVSTTVLLVLLHMWACCSRCDGGFSNPTEQEAASTIFRGILEVMQVDDEDFPIYVDDGVKCQWLGVHSGVNLVVLAVRSGRVSLVALRARMRAHCGPVSRMWDQRFGSATEMPFVAFMLVCAEGYKVWRFLWKQLLWCVASVLEARIMEQMRGEITARGIEAKLAGWETGSTYALNRKLGQYMESCRHASAGALKHLSISTDKSRVHSLGLQSTVLVLPDNTAFWGPPQAMGFQFTRPALGPASRTGTPREGPAHSSQRQKGYRYRYPKPAF